jgi:thioredoxin-related protein
MQTRFKKVRIAGIIILLLFSINSMAQVWQTDFQKSKELASSHNKPIILVFSGSDWCAPCMKLEKEIWNSTQFKEYADKNFVLHKADFPRKKKNQVDDVQMQKNKALAEKYNTKGYFPLVVVLDKNGKVLGETGYKKMTPKDYIKHIESFIE